MGSCNKIEGLAHPRADLEERRGGGLEGGGFEGGGLTLLLGNITHQHMWRRRRRKKLFCTYSWWALDGC